MVSPISPSTAPTRMTTILTGCATPQPVRRHRVSRAAGRMPKLLRYYCWVGTTDASRWTEGGFCVEVGAREGACGTSQLNSRLRWSARWTVLDPI
jgi:hypothetical protein